MYIAKLATKGTHPQEIESSLFAAFRDGTLEARAQKYDDDGETCNLETIPIDFWQSLQAHEFHRFLNNDGNTTAYQTDFNNTYKNAEILTSKLDKWMGKDSAKSSKAKELNLVTNAPPPIRSATGVRIGRKEFYAVPVKDDDYQRCITDGSIKVHRLAALACDLSPAGNISDGTNRLYNESLYNSETPLGLRFDKLRYAVDSKKIKILVHRTTEANLISLIEGIDWLERERIEVSKRLKDYAAIHVPELSAFITVTQAVSWIAFGDFDTINRTLTPQETKKLDLAKSNFLRKAQDGSVNIYGINSKHTGSQTAKAIVPREQIVTLISLGNHLIYQGENWTNLEVEKSKVLELWTASKKESSNSVEANSPYEIPDAPVHTSIGEPSQKEAAFALYKAELKGEVTGRKEARVWFKTKQYPTTWGDSFVASLPKSQKRKRQRPSIKLPAI